MTFFFFFAPHLFVRTLSGADVCELNTKQSEKGPPDISGVPVGQYVIGYHNRLWHRFMNITLPPYTLLSRTDNKFTFSLPFKYESFF